MQGPSRIASAAAGFVLAVGCASQGGPGPSDDFAVPGPIVLSSGDGGPVRDEELRFVPAVDALRASVEAGRDQEARRILGRIRAMGPTERVEGLLDAFERILDGRALAERIAGTLEARELEGRRGVYRLSLELESSAGEPIVIVPAGVRLRVVYTSVDPLGSAQRAVQYASVDRIERFALDPGDPRRWDLVELEPPRPAGMLALDARFELEFLLPQIEHEGRSLPASTLVGPTANVVRLAGYLPTGPIDPTELERYVAEGDVRVPALMERTVRIPPALRDQALERLGPLVARLSSPDLEELVPALRWLTGATSPGGDPEAWRRWMAARGRGAATADASDRGLDLPRSAR